MECHEFLENPTLDPITGEPITYQQAHYYQTLCRDNKSLQPTESECGQWLQRPNLDPRNGQILTPNSHRQRQWENECEGYGRLRPLGTGILAIPRPSELPTLVSKEELFIQRCPQLDAILSSICETVLTQEGYHDLLEHREAFARHFFKHHSACYAGDSQIYIDLNWERAVIDDMYIDFDRCIGSKTLVVSLDLQGAKFDWSGEPLGPQWNAASRRGKAIGHSMILLIDFDGRTLEFYEPNGASAPWVPLITKLLLDYFNGQPEFIGFRFIQPWEDQYCPYSGLQRVAQDEMCANWSLLYAVLRVTCPHITRGDLTEMLRMKGRSYLNKLMVHWDCYIRQYLERVGYFQAMNRLDEISDVLSNYPDLKVQLTKAELDGDYRAILELSQTLM